MSEPPPSSQTGRPDPDRDHRRTARGGGARGGEPRRGFGRRFRSIAFKPSAWLFVLALGAGLIVGRFVAPTWTVESVALEVEKDEAGELYCTVDGQRVGLEEAVPLEDAVLNPSPENIRAINETGEPPPVSREFAVAEEVINGEPVTVGYQLLAQRHWGMWSLMPAIVAIVLCWVTREPIIALFGGIVAGAFLVGEYDITDGVFVQRLGHPRAAYLLVLYLWLLGGLMGIWSRTGAAQAFAEFMTARFVRGPRSAKLVAWSLGVIFFQGGTVSTVLVGTTVKPLADKERVSHEELSYIVDSTASPIASLLAFNAWPGYVQAFLFVAGVPWLATQADRIAFFFMSVPLSFYAIFAVTLTFLMSIEKSPFLGKRMKAAIRRARETGQLDAPDAEPLSARELQASNVPAGYAPHVAEFFAPLFSLIGIAVGTFILMGEPQVTWAFGSAVVIAAVMALVRGMSLKEVMEGYTEGLKGVVLGSVILLLAVTIGGISRETGGGIYLVEMLGETIPFWLLPVTLQVMTMVIAFSTGTSFGTYAVAFPLAMPLAWEVAVANDISHPMFYMMICFATVLNGSVYGDQCSPISDTTVLSSMCTGCDLMDHVKTQIPQATIAATLAAVLWTALTFFAA